VQFTPELPLPNETEHNQTDGDDEELKKMLPASAYDDNIISFNWKHLNVFFGIP